MAISDYLAKLIELKNALAANLIAKGVTATENEKLNTLVPKVLNIKASPTVYEITSGDAYNQGRGYGGSVGKLRFDISSIPNYENLELWKNLFVFMHYEVTTSYGSDNDKKIELVVSKDGQYIYFECRYRGSITTYDKWYMYGSSATWTPQSTRYAIKVYVLE